jgi:hypothetical protein
MDIKQINSLHDLIDVAKYAAEKFSNEEIWWRGQANSICKLSPSVFRPKDGGYRYEQNIILRFTKKAITRYERCPKDDDLPGWLFLMQHYRLPTRLLDWTESIMVAAFFAVCELPSQNATLWALNPFRLNQHQTGKKQFFGTGGEETLPFFHNAFNASRPCPEKIIALITREIDIRMMVQLSAFTIHGTSTPIDDLHDNDKFLMQFLIPTAAKPTIKRELERFAICESNLFPDLEHLAKDVASLRFIEK